MQKKYGKKSIQCVNKINYKMSVNENNSMETEFNKLNISDSD